jgi:Uma2 family endonuclease
MVPRRDAGSSTKSDIPIDGRYSEAVQATETVMNMPPTLPPPSSPDPPDPEDVRGCEFVDGQWRPKHPDEWVEVEHDREGSEFVEGEWTEKSMSVSSDTVIVNLLAALNPYVRANKLGRVQGPECGYQIFPVEPKRVRKPDTSFIAAGRVSADLLKGTARIVPDLVAEVTSPNDKADLIGEKVAEYLSVGVKLVWVVYPTTKSIWIFRANGSGAWLAGAGELSGEDVVPGFSVSLDTLFAED